MPVVILASWHDADPATTRLRGRGRGRGSGRPQHSVKTFFALMLVLETMMVGVFAATDVFLFYVFFEAMLIPMYFLIGSYGGGRAAVRGGEVPALQPARRAADAGRGHRRCTCTRAAAAHRAPSTSTLFARAGSVSPGADRQKWLFLGFFIAFAIKAPLLPFHTWLPDAAARRTPGTAVLLVGVLDKVGTFGMLRFCLRAVPGRRRSYFTPVVLISRGDRRSCTARCWRSARPT